MRTFDIVFVCTGNRFRSPLAEALLRTATNDLPVRVRSVGTLPLSTLPALAQAVDLGPALGIDLSAHRSSSMQGVDLSDAHLVVGFEHGHIARAVVDAGADRRRTFLLTEVVTSLEHVQIPNDDHDDVARAVAAVNAAADFRATLGPRPLEEIEDPLGRSPAECKRIAEDIADLTIRLAHLLFSRERPEAARP